MKIFARSSTGLHAGKPMRRLIFRNSLSPTEVVLLTAYVRDIHKTYPNQFFTDVRTPFAGLWANNPHITSLGENDPGVEVIDCQSTLTHGSNEAPYHAIYRCLDLLNKQVGISVRPTSFKGDIWLSKDEMRWDSQVTEIVGKEVPFWIILAGGSNDVTVKLWDASRYQAVVDHFKGKIQFVQVGAKVDLHRQLEGVIDLRNRTTLRELIRLVYHAQGILCPVTLLMHLAAAVPTPPDVTRNRPCVVVAGGREPPHWEAYPFHQFMHSGGTLLCCHSGGCWKSRVVPLYDGDAHDRPEHLCVDAVNGIARCMSLITPEDVVNKIELYFKSGYLRYLSKSDARSTSQAISKLNRVGWREEHILARTFQRGMQTFIRSIQPFPARKFRDRGIVICAGGGTYFTCAWVCVQMLRFHRCSLPVQLWHLGDEDLSPEMARLISELNVECVDARVFQGSFPARILNGYELKIYSILHSPFKEVLLLDADNVPVSNPDALFDTQEFRNFGAVFWPDLRPGLGKQVCDLFGIRYRRESALDSGQVLVDKEKCWAGLQLTMWVNEHSDFCYSLTQGDKDTFRLAFRKVGVPFLIAPMAPQKLKGTLCQHDFNGQRVFQHRRHPKWKMGGPNPQVLGFLFETECLSFLDSLRKRWRAPMTQDASQEENGIQFGISHESNMKREPFVIKAPFDTFTGYGQHATEVVKHFKNLNVAFGVISLTPRKTCLMGMDSSLFRDVSTQRDWELLLHPPNLEPTESVSTIYFTMWETTSLPESYVRNISKATAVIVPCRWNKSILEKQGITIPSFVCPLGVNPTIFESRPISEQDLCVFGAAGNCSISGRTRKGLEDVIASFMRAFPREKNVRLRVKAMPGDDVAEPRDRRIEVVRKNMSQEELSDWYSSLTCFVSASRAEAWGLMHLQAMAVGRPVIACRFGGLEEFFDEEVGFCVDYRMGPATGRYVGHGTWAIPEPNSLSQRMRDVYSNPSEVREKGIKSSARALAFTWTRSCDQLYGILKALKVFRE